MNTLLNSGRNFEWKKSLILYVEKKAGRIDGVGLRIEGRVTRSLFIPQI